MTSVPPPKSLVPMTVKVPPLLSVSLLSVRSMRPMISPVAPTLITAGAPATMIAGPSVALTVSPMLIVAPVPEVTSMPASAP